jgi:hypothetical protein
LDDAMRVRIERRGGFGGTVAVGECSDPELTPAQRQALQKLAKSPPQPTRSRGADRFRFKVEITDDSGTQAFDLSEEAMPEELASIPKIRF